MKPETQQLLKQSETRLEAVVARIGKLTPNGYTADVSKSFYLGMVGGSGRNTYRLNKRRESEMTKSIANSSELVKLYKERDNLSILISRINSGEYEKFFLEKHEKREKLNQQLIQYWCNLKSGDKIDIGNGGALITKKNKKSLETGSGCKWTVAEIIGKEAAALIK